MLSFFFPAFFLGLVPVLSSYANFSLRFPFLLDASISLTFSTHSSMSPSQPISLFLCSRKFISFVFKIVHCSSGNGRTGVFIVVDSQLKRIDSQNDVNIFFNIELIR